MRFAGVVPVLLLLLHRCCHSAGVFEVQRTCELEIVQLRCFQDGTPTEAYTHTEALLFEGVSPKEDFDVWLKPPETWMPQNNAES